MTSSLCCPRCSADNWLREGKLVSREHVFGGGMQTFPETLLKLFAGENTGNLLLAVCRANGRERGRR